MRKLFVLGCVLALAGPALADWDKFDGHKMHFPQYPDEDGWDVKADDGICLADDWMCTGTGPVSDIHFWGSWKDGIEGTINWL